MPARHPRAPFAPPPLPLPAPPPHLPPHRWRQSQLGPRGRTAPSLQGQQRQVGQALELRERENSRLADSGSLCRLRQQQVQQARQVQQAVAGAGGSAGRAGSRQSRQVSLPVIHAMTSNSCGLNPCCSITSCATKCRQLQRWWQQVATARPRTPPGAAPAACCCWPPPCCCPCCSRFLCSRAQLLSVKSVAAPHRCLPKATQGAPASRPGTCGSSSSRRRGKGGGFLGVGGAGWPNSPSRQTLPKPQPSPQRHPLGVSTNCCQQLPTHAPGPHQNP